MLLKVAFIFTLAIICISSSTSKLPSTDEGDEGVVDTVSDFTLAVMQALADTFKRFLPEELIDFVNMLSIDDVKTMQTIWDKYAGNKNASYIEILAKINELNPGLMSRIQKLYSRIVYKINKLPYEAKMFAIKSILKFDPLIIKISEENIIKTAVEVYQDYQKLSPSAKDAIVKQFPFVGEIAKARLFEEYVFKQTKAPMKSGH